MIKARRLMAKMQRKVGARALCSFILAIVTIHSPGVCCQSILTPCSWDML